LILVTLFLAACSLGRAVPQASPGGDGACRSPEDAQNCPADCPAPAPIPNRTSESVAAPDADAPLFMTTMTHMEGNFTDDRSRIAKVCVYLPASIYVPSNEAVLRYFFGQMRLLAEEGLVTWASQLQVYQAFIAWNE
jgi:hypothetical protein